MDKIVPSCFVEKNVKLSFFLNRLYYLNLELLLPHCFKIKLRNSRIIYFSEFYLRYFRIWTAKKNLPSPEIVSVIFTEASGLWVSLETQSNIALPSMANFLPFDMFRRCRCRLWCPSVVCKAHLHALAAAGQSLVPSDVSRAENAEA